MSNSNCARVEISRIDSEYANTIIYTLNLNNQNCFSLSFNFSTRPQPTLPLNTFTLTDATYGLPITGSLLFTST